MKTRVGFVSNSSSSSFVLAGGSIGYDDAVDYFVDHDEIIKDMVISLAKTRNTYGDRHDLGEEIANRLREMLDGKMYVEFISDFDEIKIGIDITNPDQWNKTINQILEEARQLVSKLPEDLIPYVDFEYGELPH